MHHGGGERENPIKILYIVKLKLLFCGSGRGESKIKVWNFSEPIMTKTLLKKNSMGGFALAGIKLTKLQLRYRNGEKEEEWNVIEFISSPIQMCVLDA